VKLLKNFSTYWSNLIGDENQFSMENRIFNGICIFAIPTGLINAIINICLGLIEYGLLMLPIIVILFICYYISRYTKYLNVAVIISAAAFNVLCGATYFASSASNGVNLFTFILIIFILTLVLSKKQFWYWIPLNIILLIVLLMLEYQYPNLVENLYDSPQHKLLDLAQTFFEVILMIILITLFMKRSYNREKELAQSRLVELKESNETKNKLFSIVAHDLKAPLASIENYLSLLNELELSKDEKITIEKNLLASTRQTSEMLQNILSWSKDQMDGITTNLIPIYVHQTLNHTIQFQNSLAREKGIELSYIPNLELKAIADPDMLQLIVRNLLNNAIKFSSSGDKIELTTREEGNTCLIIISDTGIGISDEKKDALFSLKNKGTYGTNNEKGVGLGLKLAKTYVELQNGQIWFESTQDEGTTFYVRLTKA
jgi:two-component system sensor histidine kinase/response regulator